MSDESAPLPPPAPPAAAPKKPRYKPVDVPSPEQLAQEDVLNNCFTRSVIASVMGALAPPRSLRGR